MSEHPICVAIIPFSYFYIDFPSVPLLFAPRELRGIVKVCDSWRWDLTMLKLCNFEILPSLSTARSVGILLCTAASVAELIMVAAVYVIIKLYIVQ
jgi:hypothetical protein